MFKKVILCVDDENIVLQGLKEQLMNMFGNEYSIEAAESGEEALETFTDLFNDNYEVTVVISDYLMPSMKGDELLEKIHRLSPKTSNIMLTGQADSSAVINAVNNANLFKYIGKPWSGKELKAAVDEAIECFNKDKVMKEEDQKNTFLIKELAKKSDIKTCELADLQGKLKSLQVLPFAKKISEILPMLEEIGDFLGVISSNIVLLNKQHINVNVNETNSISSYIEKEKSLYSTIIIEIQKILAVIEKMRDLMSYSQDESIQPISAVCIENALEEIDNRIKTIISLELK